MSMVMPMRILFSRQLFENPAYIIECHKLSEVKDALVQMEKALARGFYLAGFLSYEAGYAFEKVLRDSKTYEFPLICFGAYSSFFPPETIPASEPKKPRSAPNLTKNKYLSNIKKIKTRLAAGDSYQVNFTFKLKFDFRGNPLALYQKLKTRQSTLHSAFIETDKFSILSLSPELFFKKRGNKIKVRPMKGTIRPGKGRAEILKNDLKNRSENVMIVDLLRNDLGRIAKTGTVKTTKLFEIEKYETLYQMTSTVEADVPEGIKLHDLFRNIFPSGSVTGAPKIRTMQIIRELEKEERKIYTGSIGFITPQKDMVFNVAIRTLLLSTSDPERSRGGHRTFDGEMGVGSGITYGSDPEAEYQECLLKAKFLES
jgi:para-aminobenzoate synthetase/4-amino-4-deoxychorismate lyase